MTEICSFVSKKGNKCNLYCISNEEIFCKMHKNQQKNKENIEVSEHHCVFKMKNGLVCSLNSILGDIYCKMHKTQLKSNIENNNNIDLKLNIEEQKLEIEKETNRLNEIIKSENKSYKNVLNSDKSVIHLNNSNDIRILNKTKYYGNGLPIKHKQYQVVCEQYQILRKKYQVVRNVPIIEKCEYYIDTDSQYKNIIRIPIQDSDKITYNTQIKTTRKRTVSDDMITHSGDSSFNIIRESEDNYSVLGSLSSILHIRESKNNYRLLGDSSSILPIMKPINPDAFKKHTIVKELYGMLSCVSSIQGYRATMEDRHIMESFTLDNNFKCTLLGVFDGHGGKEVSDYIANNYLCYLIIYLSKCTIEELNDPLIIKRIFIKLHKKLDDHVKIYYNSGSTATITLITDKYIFFCNCGDSRSVLFDWCKDIVCTTIDHKPDSDSESKRIKELGGIVKITGRCPRVYNSCGISGGLALSRSFGDFTLKRNADIVTSVPDVFFTKRNEKMKVIILGCDGIWDVFTNETIKTCINANEDNLKTNTEYIIDKSLELGSRDNITVIKCLL
jgi:protein phosphatase 1L